MTEGVHVSPWEIYVIAGGVARVHETAVLEGTVYLSPGVEIGAFAYVRGPVTIGARTLVSPHVVIGTDGEHRSKPANVGTIAIGEDVVIREFSAVQRGTGDRPTTIGDRVMVMDHGHVAHDVTIEEDVTLSPNVTLGGHTRVHRGATIGIGAMTHQFTTVGAYAMIGMGSVVTRDVPPFALVVGNPAKYVRENAPRGEVVGTRDGWNGRFFADRGRGNRQTIDLG